MARIEGFREKFVPERQKFIDLGYSGPVASANAAFRVMQGAEREAYDKGIKDISFWEDCLRREYLIAQSVPFANYWKEKREKGIE
ncbi:MAG TPA: hypothetical protein VG895_04435 [Patescibacteria group bacterium]|nr:hypothetical protein [Patescibacteria group bacterium]